MLGELTQVNELADDSSGLIPDKIGTVTVWRSWDVTLVPKSDGSEQLRLASPSFNGYVWTPNKRAKATCGGDEWRRMCTKDRCGCGFNGWDSAKRLREHYETAAVWGSVRMWGRVREYEQGSRGEFAYPERLFVDPDRCAGRNPDELAAQLAEIYGVTCTVRRRKDGVPTPLNITWRALVNTTTAPPRLFTRALDRTPFYGAYTRLRTQKQDAHDPKRERRIMLGSLLLALPFILVFAAAEMWSLEWTQLVGRSAAQWIYGSVAIATLVAAVFAGGMLMGYIMDRRTSTTIELVGLLSGFVVMIFGVFGPMALAFQLMYPMGWNPALTEVDWQRPAAQALKSGTATRTLTDRTRPSFDYDVTIDSGECSFSSSSNNDVLVCRKRDQVTWTRSTDIANGKLKLAKR